LQLPWEVYKSFSQKQLCAKWARLKKSKVKCFPSYMEAKPVGWTYVWMYIYMYISIYIHTHIIYIEQNCISESVWGDCRRGKVTHLYMNIMYYTVSCWILGDRGDRENE
jgi:hypothetical protein